MTTTAQPVAESVAIGAEEYVELEQGVPLLANALKNAARLCGALEINADDRQGLEEQRGGLLALLEGDAKRTTIPPHLIQAARVVTRFRHGQLVGIQGKEKKAAVEQNEYVAQRIETCEALGRKLGLQLDAIDHGHDEDQDDGQMDLGGGGEDA